MLELGEFVRCKFPEGMVEYYTRIRYHHVVNRMRRGSVRRVLDIGCGWGYGTNILAGYFEEVVGVDFHRPYIEYARQEYPDINFALWDAQTLELKRFDLYVALEVMECFESATRVLSKWVESLEGTLIVYTLDGRKPQPRAMKNPYVRSILTPLFVRSVAEDAQIWYTNPQYFWFEISRGEL